MKRINLLIGLLLLAGIQSGFSQSKEERQQIELEVTQLGDKLAAFIIAGNVDSIASIYSPNCHFIMEFEPIREKREEVAKYYKSIFKKGKSIDNYKFERNEMKVYGDLVLEIGSVQFQFRDGDQDLNVKYQYSLIWKKSKSEEYRIRSAMWNSPVNPCK